MFKRHHHRLISWIAITAVLFAALAPAISHAYPAQHLPQTLWQQLCTAQGTKLIAGATQNNPEDAARQESAPGSVGMHFGHCPYCFSHAGAIGLIHDGAPIIAQLNLSYSAPRLFYQSPYPLFAWIKSSPRAPPFIS